jgi:hypothetical protein
MQKLIFLLLLLPTYCVAQGSSREDTLVVTNSSGSDAPLSATGTAVLSSTVTREGVQSNSKLTAELKNVSSKPIMAFEVVVDLFASYGGGDRIVSRVDYFFSNQALMPNSTSPLSVSPHQDFIHWSQGSPPSTLGDIGHPPSPKADVKVTFVEFADGTAFGGCEWASGLSARREKMIEIIDSLLRAFDRDKETGLSSAIEREQAKADNSSELHSLLADARQKLRDKGPSATVEFLRKYVANAERNSGAAHR